MAAARSGGKKPGLDMRGRDRSEISHGDTLTVSIDNHINPPSRSLFVTPNHFLDCFAKQSRAVARHTNRAPAFPLPEPRAVDSPFHKAGTLLADSLSRQEESAFRYALYSQWPSRRPKKLQQLREVRSDPPRLVASVAGITFSELRR